LFESGILPELVIVSLVHQVDWFQRHPFRVLFLQVERKIAIQNVGKNGLSLFRIIGIELETFNHESIREKEDWDFG